MNTRALRSAALVCFASLIPVLAGAQTQNEELIDRLSVSARGQVYAMRDSARMAGLPTEGLLDLARQRVAKRSGSTPTDAQIVASVRDVYINLGVARTALGSSATLAEVSFGATALKDGADEASLVRLRRAGGAASLEVPLAVLSVLVKLEVKPRDASELVRQLVAAEVSEPGFVRFKDEVTKDVRAGRLPLVSATDRAAALVAETLSLRDKNAGPRRPIPPPED